MDKNPALNTNLEHFLKMLGELAWATLSSVGVLSHLIHPLMSESWHMKPNSV